MDGEYCGRRKVEKSLVKEKKRTCVSTIACSTSVYEYGVGCTRVAALGSGSLFFAAVSDLLIGNFCF